MVQPLERLDIAHMRHFALSLAALFLGLLPPTATVAVAASPFITVDTSAPAATLNLTQYSFIGLVPPTTVGQSFDLTVCDIGGPYSIYWGPNISGLLPMIQVADGCMIYHFTATPSLRWKGSLD